MPVLKKTLILLLLLPLLMLNVPPEASHTASLLRLHVRANSDSPEDQAVKYQVRDTVLHVLDSHLQRAGTAEAARQEVARILPDVISAAQETVKAAGFDYQVSAALGSADFPTRLYGDKVYRAGEYQALQIYLGDGLGQNWWCVLFPPLCFVETRNETSSDITAAVVPAGKKMAPLPFKSRLLEWWRRIFGKR